jgi:hypothetical protein
MVAPAVCDDTRSPDAIEPSVIAFLNGDEIIQWATVTLGL